MTAIAYDLPVLNLISGLDATEHVTHVRHRKEKVTLHHNGGILTHQGVLDVWKVRPASAHFNLDAPGTVAQYVRVNEYAWATGNTLGNQTSISIEMCNSTRGPSWLVGEATWRGAARLAGWLFARVIGERPTRDSLVLHSYWSATDCAGPYIRSIYNQILALAQEHYDRFTGAIVPAPPVPTPVEEKFMASFQGYAMQVLSGPLTVDKDGENIPVGSAWVFDQRNVTLDYHESPEDLLASCEKYDIMHMGVTGRYVKNLLDQSRISAELTKAHLDEVRSRSNIQA